MDVTHTCRWLQVAGLLLAGFLLMPALRAEPYFLVVAGLGGQPGYEKQFVADAKAVAAAARRMVSAPSRVHMLSGSAVSKDSLDAAFKVMAKNAQPDDFAVVVLIGHGSFDGTHYKFNIPGPDVTDDELRQWLDAIPARTQLVVDATSASGAVLQKWAAPGRTVITATRNGVERNASRFGAQWASGLSNATADGNKDGVITVKEAFAFAERAVAALYKKEGTIATEHARMQGQAAATRVVARLGQAPQKVPALAAQYARMAELEGRIEALRQRRDAMPQAAYFDQLQGLLVELAKVQATVDQATPGKVTTGNDVDRPDPATVPRAGDRS